MPKQTASAQPLSVLPAKMSPFGVPEEETLLKQHEIGGRLFGNAFQGKRLGSGQDIVESTNDWKGGLSMVSNHDMVSINKFKVELVPFKHIFPSLLLFLKYLGAEKLNL
jgi:hypothetical protein